MTLSGLQPREPNTPSVLTVIHSPKRVRVEAAGLIVAESDRALLLRSNHFLPVYFFPPDAVSSGILSPSEKRSRHSLGEEIAYWDITVGDSRLKDAAWSFHAPQLQVLQPLLDHVAIDWKSVDHWFEEAEEIFGHAKDPYARIDVLDSTRHVEVLVAGERVAETKQPVLLFETHLPTRYYLQPQDVRFDRLVPSQTKTRCPYKGIASYWSFTQDDGSLLADVAWSYQDPLPEVSKIKGLIAFYPQHVDAIRVDGATAS